MKRVEQNKKAQATVEFTFAVVVIMFIIYGMVQMFRWAGMDLAQRRYLQDRSITTLDFVNGDPSSQLDSDINIVQPMSAVYRGGITTGNTSQ